MEKVDWHISKEPSLDENGEIYYGNKPLGLIGNASSCPHQLSKIRNLFNNIKG